MPTNVFPRPIRAFAAASADAGASVGAEAGTGAGAGVGAGGGVGVAANRLWGVGLVWAVWYADVDVIDDVMDV